ncbi:MAG TPA: flagellar biosynthetic protein FliO [Terracidiphilus sp.]|nr:flagellar biosynthetic protein FliO [Terracidiphilus sp.]
MEKTVIPAGVARPRSGWAGWLLARLCRPQRSQPRLALLERISLAPRQSVALIEAEGRRILVATSADGGSAFYALDQDTRRRSNRIANPPFASRVSW